MFKKQKISFLSPPAPNKNPLTTKIIILEFLYNRFSTPLHKLVEIQNEVRKFKQAKPSDGNKNRVLIFFLGACVHWVGLICYRHKNRFEYNFFDSKNHDLLFLNESQIKENLLKRGNLFKWSEWKKKINTQMVYDYQTLISLIVDSLNSEPRFMDHMLYNDIFKILPLFRNHPKVQAYRKKYPKMRLKTDRYFEELAVSKNQNKGGSGAKICRESTFASNVNPAADSYMEGKYLDLSKEIYSNLKSLNKNLSRYENYSMSMSQKAQDHYLEAQNDVKILNHVFKYRDRRWVWKRK